MSKHKKESPSNVTIRAFACGDEPEIMEVLAKCHPGTWGSRTMGFWEWRNRKHPRAQDSDIVVGEKDDRIVACYHGAVFPFKIDADLDLLMSIDGDYAVHPEHRGGNMTDLAFRESDRDLLERGAALRGGFARQELNENLYRKRFGYVYVRTTNTWFRKPLAFERYKRRVGRIGRKLLQKDWLRHALRRRSFAVNFSVDEFPECCLLVDDRAFELRKGFRNIPISRFARLTKSQPRLVPASEPSSSRSRSTPRRATFALEVYSAHCPR